MQADNHVGPIIADDGEIRPGRLTYDGAFVCKEFGGKYLEPVMRGQGFHYTQPAAGVALAAPTTGANTIFMIWNPSNSGRLLVPSRIKIGIVSTATVLGNIGLYTLASSGDIGTAAPVVSYTAGTPQNALIGGGKASKMRFAPAVENLVVAPTYLGTLGLSLYANDLTGKNAVVASEDLDSQVIIPPGTAFFIAANAAVATVAVISCFGLELTLPPELY
jgi:hypothetical protein